MTRFIASVLFALASVSIGSTHALAADRRPNLVFIFTDDQRADALGVVQREQGDKARFPWLESPNLDRLASQGVRFRNAFVVNALCSPSRASFLTGTYGHKNGIRNNGTPLAEDSVTHASLLRQSGYKTGYVGKWHQGQQKGQRPGFDFSASFIGQGTYFNCPVEVNGVAQQTTGWIDDISTDFAEKFIDDNRDNPFLLVVGYKTCHGPFQPPARHEATYGNAGARPVPNQKQEAIYKKDQPKAAAVPKKKAEATKKKADAAKKQAAPPISTAIRTDGLVNTNLGMFRGLRAIDENVGRLLKKLDDLKLADDTMIVYSSDNGYYLGEHGLGDKRSAYEESMRVPMIVRYPRSVPQNKTLDQMVLNIDLAPTLLDFAGVPVPATMQGRSWRPLLQGKPVPDWRKSFFYCYFREPAFNVPMVTAVRTDTAKLVVYPGHPEWTEVFDLGNDPYEMKNLAADPAAAGLKSGLEAEYKAAAGQIDFPLPARDEPAKPKAAGKPDAG
ncbi:MAG: sulfatase [bacterium]